MSSEYYYLIALTSVWQTKNLLIMSYFSFLQNVVQSSSAADESQCIYKWGELSKFIHTEVDTVLFNSFRPANAADDF